MEQTQTDVSWLMQGLSDPVKVRVAMIDGTPYYTPAGDTSKYFRLDSSDSLFPTKEAALEYAKAYRKRYDTPDFRRYLQECLDAREFGIFPEYIRTLLDKTYGLTTDDTDNRR